MYCVMAGAHSYAAQNGSIEDISLSSHRKAVSIPPSTAQDQEEYLHLQKQMILDEELQFWGVGLFKSQDIFGKGICTLTGSNWSHVGAVLMGKSGTCYSYESTGDPEQLLEKGILPQVQIQPFLDVVENYKGNVAKRQFIFKKDKPDPTTVKHYVLENLGKPYEKDLTHLIKAIHGMNTVEDNTSVFCSEEVARFMRALKIRNDNNSSENFVPRHFGDIISQPVFDGDCGGCLGEIEILKEIKEKNACCFGCCTLL